MLLTHPNRECRRCPKGFTLIELMVATGIMMLLVLAVVSMTGNVMDIWSNASGRLGANAEARVALEYLGDDLETLVVRPKDQIWLEVTYSTAVANSPTIPNYTRHVPTLSMITATEHRDSAAGSVGNICAVNYQLAFQNPVTEDVASGPTPPSVYGLYRTVIDPTATFNNILSQATPASFSGENLLNWITGGQDVAIFKNFLSSNIIDLSVVFYAEDTTNVDGDADTDVVPITVGNTPDGAPLDFVYSDRIYVKDSGGYTDAGLGALVYADIRMTILSDEGAKEVSAISGSVSGRSMDDVISDHGIVFTRRVPIMSRH